MQTESQTLPAKELAELRELAAGDAARANVHGVDLNPFSTQGARREWQQGFNNESAEANRFCRFWWRGFYARQLTQI